MSVEENKAIARRFYDEVMTNHNLAVVDELVADDVADYAVPPGGPTGREGARQGLQMFLSAFPDLRCTIEDQVAEGDRVVSRFTLACTHRGELMGIPATGRLMSIPGISVLRLDGGRIAEVRAQLDMLGMLQQLGVIPAPQQSAT